jgi:hypothetical protein
VRPGDPGWPSEADWQRLRDAVGGRLIAVTSPLDACRSAPETCDAVFAALRNPYYLRDQPGLTQALGWVDAWTSRPSAFAIAARSAEDVAAAVRFARQHDLRLVVKGGGHAYQGGSSAPDSLLVWTREMTAVEIHDGFVPDGCTTPPVPAVSPRRRRDLGRGLRRRRHRRRPLRPGRRLPDRRRRRPRPRRWFRTFLQEFRPRGCEHARSGDRHRRRHGAPGERLPRP